MSYNTPTDLRYLKTHEWVRFEGDEVVFGITDYAQHSLGDIVFIELPDVGDTVVPGDRFGVIESVKASSDLYSPVGGVVIAVNTALDDDQEVINNDPYGQGWMIRLKASGEQGELLEATAYDEVVAAEEHK